MARRPRAGANGSPPLAEVVAWLKREGTAAGIADQARYGIEATRPFGVAVGALKGFAKTIGRDHDLATELWATGRYEARMLASMVDEPERLTVRQLNAWAKDFDNWAIVDSACFHLFDRTPLAWKRIEPWSNSRAEFTKRAAFALIWGLTVHDKEADDGAFEACLPVIERAATDGRTYVKKGVDMALRAIGKRNHALNRAASKAAKRLASSDDPTASWVGGHALRELQSAAVKARLTR